VGGGWWEIHRPLSHFGREAGVLAIRMPAASDVEQASFLAQRAQLLTPAATKSTFSRPYRERPYREQLGMGYV
jgi:hypothetical protein